LIHLDPSTGNHIQYTKDEGLPSNSALDIVKGNEGMIWVGTRMGPAKFDSKTGVISSVGLPKGRYNYGISKTDAGQIFIGANNGLISFYPDQVIGNPNPPQLAISEMLISDINYLEGRALSDDLILSHELISNHP